MKNRIQYYAMCLVVAVFSFISNGYSGNTGLYPRPSGPVADYANIIDAQTKMKLNGLARALWMEGRFGLVVATVPDIGDTPIEDYAVELYKKWGIGSRKESEGILLLLAMSPRKVRIEAGYGSEGYLNDAKTGRILDVYGIPSFQKGAYSEGLLNVSIAIASVVAKEKQIDLGSIQTFPVGTTVERGTGQFSLFHIILMILAGIFLLGTPFGRMLLISMLLSSGRRGFGGGFGGGLGGGGFGGGFGGGMSGGGGASRSF